MRRAPIAVILLCALAEAANSQLIKLNVAALDAQGQPASGLSSADFKILEDGKARDIAFFRFTGGKALEGKPAPGEYSNRNRTVRHPTVVLIDLLSDRIMSDSTIGREVTDALKNLEASDDLFLYILTSRGGLYPVHALPKSEAEWTPAAEPWTRHIAPLMDEAIKNLFGRRPVDNGDIGVRWDLTLSALRDLGGQMAEISGRKNLVWVTHGIPLIGYSSASQERLDSSDPLRWFCEQLQQVQIAVYTVEQSMAGAAAAVGTSNSEALLEFTSLTGGRDYSSDRTGAAIEQARMDSRANFEVAYYSGALRRDGKHHKIRVVCGRKEVKLQTERGFYALRALNSSGGLAPVELRSRELPMEVETVVRSPFDAGGIGLRARVSRDADTSGKMRFEVHINAADLLPRNLAPSGAGKVSVVFAAYDDERQQAAAPVLVDVAAQQLEKETRGEITLSEAIPVGAGVRKVRVIVSDAELRAVGSITIPVN